jgi:nucleoid DNA-binding protein
MSTATAKPKRMTKAQVIGELSDKTGLTKKQVSSVFDELRDIVKKELGRRGPGEFVLPELALKLKVRKVAPMKNKAFRNPSTGETFYKDVPASKKLRATPLKKLKEMVLS